MARARAVMFHRGPARALLSGLLLAKTPNHRHGACGWGTILRGPCRSWAAIGQTRCMGFWSQSPHGVAMMAMVVLPPLHAVLAAEYGGRVESEGRGLRAAELGVHSRRAVARN